LKQAQIAGRALQIQLDALHASTEPELDSAFAALAKLHAQGLVVATDPFFDSRREQLVTLAAKHSVATSYTWREYVLAGGLMSYAANRSGTTRPGVCKRPR
jgi:putative ABC transport system substrate-binding protein